MNDYYPFNNLSVHKSEYERYFGKNSLAILITDRKNNNLYVNYAFTILFGYHIEDIPTISDWFKNAYPKKEYQQKISHKYLRNSNSNKAEKQYDLPEITNITAKNGDIKAIRSYKSLFGNDYLTIFLDISTEKRHEELAIKAQKIESVGVLAGGIAHDFNNILTTILGNLSYIKIGIDEQSELSDSIEEMEKALLRAKKITQQLLTFSKGGHPVRDTYDIKEIIKETANFSLHGTRLKSIYTFDSDIYAVKVDHGQISQVISNLIINANQAMPLGGTIEIKASNFSIYPENHHESLKAGDYVKIEVIDQGTGIKVEDKKNIFVPYFSTKKKGNGLGLASTYSIISQHGGYIDFKSIEGEGTNFFFFLPAISGIKVKEIEIEEKIPNDLGLKIILMDDQTDILHMTKNLLKRLGCIVLMATDGKRTIEIYLEEMAKGNNIDCIILDLTIPGGWGGKETLDYLLKIDPKIISIVSSGYSTDPIMANYQNYGFTYSMPKPYTLRELKKTLYMVKKQKKD